MLQAFTWALDKLSGLCKRRYQGTRRIDPDGAPRESRPEGAFGRFLREFELRNAASMSAAYRGSTRVKPS